MIAVVDTAGHGCPAKGCGVTVERSKLACSRHWFDLPKQIRDRVWAAFRTHGMGSAEHTDAVGAALDWFRSQPDPQPPAEPIPGLAP